MNLKQELMNTSYLPVPWIYREIIAEEIGKSTFGKINYFCNDDGICTAEGRILCIEEIPDKGVFIHLKKSSEKPIRIDRIITLFGKPGAAYDEYDSYANACMDCMGGYEKDEL